MDTTGVIKTKLFIPQAVGATLHRSRLFERLDQHGGWKLTLISAAAGFGKTTLVTDWLKINEQTTAWVSLDDTDRRAEDVLRYVVLALEPHFPELAQQLLPLLNSPDAPATQTIAASLINALAEDGQEILLVLDDYHSIEAVEIHDLIWFLIQHGPENFKTILITRSDPPFPLARLRSKMQLLELRVDDLAFSQEELANFLQGQDMSLGNDQIQRLHVLTEGWIAGAKLAVLSMTGDDVNAFLDAFSGTDRNIMDYLIEEVLAHQDEDTRHFLLKTSILRRLNEELCDWVLEQSNSQVVLTALENENLFITATDQNRQWFRYHHLFAQILRYRLKSAFASEINDLHARACQWHTEHGDISEAIFHAEAGKDEDALEELIETHAGPLLQQGRLMELGSWFEKLSPARITANTDLCILKAWQLLLTGELAKVPELLAHVSQGSPSGQEKENILANVAAINAYLSLFTGDPQQAIIHAESALEASDANDDDTISVAAFILGNALSMTGQFDSALEAYDRAIASAVRIKNPHIELPARNAAAPIERLLGQLTVARTRYLKVLEMFEGSAAPPPPLAISYLGLGDLYLDKNEIRKASEYIEKGTRISDQWGNAEVKLQASMVQTRLFLTTRDHKRAGESLALLESQLLQRGHHYHKMDQIHALNVRFRLAAVSAKDARKYLDKHELGIGNGQPDSLLNMLTHIRVLIHEKGYETAWERVQELAAAFSNTANVLARLDMSLLAAIVAYQVTDREVAIQYLEQALDIARPEKILRPFLDCPGDLEPLLSQTKGSKTPESDQFRTRIALELSSSGMLETRDGLVENLSGREIEVLTLVTQGLSNVQISKQLFISLSTVKTHLLHIYQKLDVKNRTAAGERARQLGLL